MSSKAHLRTKLEQLLSIYCRGNVLDLGAGHAKYRKMIVPHSDVYTTLDNMGSDYQFVAGAERPDVIAPVEKTGLPGSSFDTIICTEVIEHVENPFEVFAEISRLLKQHGNAIVSSGWIAAYHREPKDYWRFSEDAYRVLAERNGMEVRVVLAKGGVYTAALYLFLRNIELNGKSPLVKKVANRLRPRLETIAEYLDGSFDSQDTIGHAVVVHKP